jgi:hypothetical protein
MNHLLNFPTEMVAKVFLPLLTLTDLVRLDCAVTNHLLRPQLYEVFRFLSVAHAENGLTSNQMSWFLDRSIALAESIVFAKGVSEEDIKCIFHMLQRSTRASQVRHVDFSRCHRYHAQGLRITRIMQDMLKGCPALESLNMSQCIDINRQMLTRLGKECPGIRSLVLSGTNVTGAGLIALTNMCGLMVELDLSHCTNMNDPSIISVAQNCPLLTMLNLTCCRNISDSSVIALTLNCAFLTSLNLTSCGNITDGAVIAVARRYPALRGLELCFCDRISDTAVITLSESCGALTVLDLRRCRLITDAAVLFVSRNCRALTSLTLDFCPHITTASVIALAESCPLLVELSARDCENLCAEVARSILDLGCCPLAILHTINQ